MAGGGGVVGKPVPGVDAGKVIDAATKKGVSVSKDPDDGSLIFSTDDIPGFPVRTYGGGKISRRHVKRLNDIFGLGL
jgi:hypothetical protein